MTSRVIQLSLRMRDHKLFGRKITLILHYIHGPVHLQIFTPNTYTHTFVALPLLTPCCLCKVNVGHKRVYMFVCLSLFECVFTVCGSNGRTLCCWGLLTQLQIWIHTHAHNPAVGQFNISFGWWTASAALWAKHHYNTLSDLTLIRAENHIKAALWYRK